MTDQADTDEIETLIAHSVDTLDGGELGFSLLSDDTVLVDLFDANQKGVTARVDLTAAREAHARLGALLYAADYPA
jgi:hypothetical protein